MASDTPPEKKWIVLVTLEDTAQRLHLSPRSLADKRFRARLGLPGVKIGRRLLFQETDIERVIQRGQEDVSTKEQ